MQCHSQVEHCSIACIKTCDWTEVAKSPCLVDCVTSRKGLSLLILRVPGLLTQAG